MPTVACYCQDFLKPDMQHVHRQIMSLSRWQPAVITQKRENAEQFPFPQEKNASPSSLLCLGGTSAAPGSGM